MYFAEASDETVRKQLCCHLCSSRFEDPRLLPCGETLCNKCIRNRCENNGDFRCVFCEKTHQVSDELLPENKLIQKLTSNLRSNSKIATKDVDELKLTLSNIERRCRELKDITEKNSIVEIRNYTDFLRNEIDVITESMSQYVYKFNKELVEKVDSYERECIENIKNSSDGFKEFHRLLFDVENFAKYCLSNLEELKDTRASIETGKEHLKRLQIEEVKQKRVKFNHKMLKFKENPTRFNSSLIGELFYSTKIGPVNNQFISSIDLKSILAYQNIDHICVERLENENIALVCSSILKEFNSRLVLLNSCEPWTVLNQSELITNRRFDALFTCKNRNTLFICIVVNFENTVKCLDEELNPFGSLTIDDSPINSLAANSAQLLAWSSIGSKIYSFSYQPEFGLLRTIQLNVQRPNEPFYLPRFVCRMQVDERRFYLLDYDYNLILMDLEGRVTSRFKINSNNFLLTDESVLVVMDRVNSRLVYFDISSGLPIKERKLQTNLVNDDLVAVNSSQFGELFFFSHSDKSIYIYLS